MSLSPHTIRGICQIYILNVKDNYPLGKITFKGYHNYSFIFVTWKSLHVLSHEKYQIENIELQKKIQRQRVIVILHILKKK